jgi:hypothetical protein
MHLRHLPPLLLSLATSSSAWACAACGAGDPSIAVVGSEKPQAGTVRFTVEASYRYAAAAAHPEGVWLSDRLALTPGVAWTAHRRVVLTATVPLVMASERSPSLAWGRGFGLGDSTLGARVVALRTDGPFEHLGGVSMGLELPTGVRVKQDGAPTSEHTQPGTGAWSPTAGLWYGGYGSFASVFASVTGRYSSPGWDAHRPGSGVLATVAAQLQPIPEVAPRLSLDTRWLDADRVDGAPMPGTGGWLVQVTPGAAFSPGRDVVLTLAVGIPVLQAGYDDREGVSPRLGVSVEL